MRFFATLLLVLATPVLAQTWTPQTSGTTVDLSDVHFVSQTAGWAVADGGLLLSTTDGGVTWDQQTLGGGGLDLQGIGFNPSGTVGLIVTDAGSVYRTADAGATWTLLSTGMTDGRAAISWADDATVWVAGRDANAAISTDAGQTWASRPTGSSERTESIAAVSATQAWVVNREGQLRTTPDGTAWAPLATGTASDLKDMQMLDATTGYIAANGNAVLKTTDGAAWANVATSGVSGNGLHVLDAATVWVVGDAGDIWFTSDGGASWSRQASGTTQAFNRVHFVSPTRGWAVGDAGTIVAFASASTASGEAPTAGFTLSASPNPARQRLSVSLNTTAPEALTVRVVDVLGREVARLHDGPLPAGAHAFAAPPLAPGAYVVVARSERGAVATRQIHVVG